MESPGFRRLQTRRSVDTHEKARAAIDMYRGFFGLEKRPFDLTADPNLLFLSSQHREALAGLSYAVLARKGFVVLASHAGMGKTTLLTTLFQRLPANVQ